MSSGPRSGASGKSPFKRVTVDDDFDAIVNFIVATSYGIYDATKNGPLVRNKSFTKEDKADVIERLKAIADAASILRSRRPDPDATVMEPAFPNVKDVIRDVLREELALHREHVKLDAPKSFASVVASNVKNVKTPKSRPALVIESASSDVKSSKDVVNVWRRGVSFKDVSFAPAKVQPVSNGKVRVEFDDVNQRDIALDKLKSVKDVKAEPARRSRPLVIVKGVSKDVSEDDVAGLIIQQNPGLNATDDDVRRRFVRRNRKDHLFNIVFEVSPTVRVKLLQQQRVNVDHQRLRVDDFSSLLQCYKCLGFGHTRAKCTSDVNVCSYCASTDHRFDVCPNKDDKDKLKCHNCSKSGKTSDVKHSATSAKACPQIKSMQKRIISRTDYGN